jgi:hypothetical protein
MFKVIDLKKLSEMGFRRDGRDYTYRGMIDGAPRVLFTIYAGSPYIRSSKSSYAAEEQFKCIYEWTKNGYIEWEDY